MQVQSSSQTTWLRSYYFARAIFSIAWVAAAVALGAHPAIAAILLVVYPAWDAAANLVDARANGGLKVNPSQSLNVAASTVMTIVVILAVMKDNHAVLAAFGIWAILSGLLQLYTGVRRWRSYGAQWAMVLSGAQSTLAGGFMISQSLGTQMPGILDIAPYASFGAFYFLVSAIWLTIAAYRTSSVKA